MNKTSSDIAHPCANLFVHCMDFRIQMTLEKLLETLGIKGNFDRLSVKGGAANFEELKVHLAAARQLHGASNAILTVHENCGAGAKAEDLHVASKMAQELGYKTRCFFIKLNGTWEEIVTQ